MENNKLEVQVIVLPDAMRAKLEDRDSGYWNPFQDIGDHYWWLKPLLVPFWPLFWLDEKYNIAQFAVIIIVGTIGGILEFFDDLMFDITCFCEEKVKALGEKILKFFRLP